MDKENLEHIELTDEEMKKTVGGKDYVQHMRYCLQVNGFKQNEINQMGETFNYNFAYYKIFVPELNSNPDKLLRYQRCAMSVYGKDRIHK